MAVRGSDRDTIAAIATASGDGGVGIVRLSGKEAVVIAGKIFVSKNGQSIADQKGFTARYGHVLSEGKTLDEAILLVMRAPKSYTTEDVAEIQVHGGSVILQEVLALAIRQGALKLVTPAKDGGGEDRLYDLARDPGEKSNVIGEAEHAGALKRLRTIATHYRAEALREAPGTATDEGPTRNK